MLFHQKNFYKGGEKDLQIKKRSVKGANSSLGVIVERKGNSGTCQIVGEKEPSGNGEKAVMTVCNSHCGGQCLFKVYVKDGMITRIETD